MPDVPYLAQFQLDRTKYKAIFSILTEVLRDTVTILMIVVSSLFS